MESFHCLPKYVIFEFDSFVKRRSNFYGIELKGEIMETEKTMEIDKKYKTNSPYFPNNETFKENGFMRGLIYDVWRILELNLNFTSTLYKRKKTDWGTALLKYPNGSLYPTGAINELYSKRIDAAIGPLRH